MLASPKVLRSCLKSCVVCLLLLGLRVRIKEVVDDGFTAVLLHWGGGNDLSVIELFIIED